MGFSKRFQECPELEFALQDTPVRALVPLELTDKGQSLQQRYVADFVCYDKIILEIKAVDHLSDQHRAQVLNYVNATGYRLGDLVNFGHDPKLEWEWIGL